MIIVNQGHEFITPLTPERGMQIVKNIEKIARTCYRSEDSIKEGSAEKMVRALIRRGHGAMLEHESVSVRCFTDRAIANEMVRHRMASYAQESTRYCNYAKEKHQCQIKVIPPFEEDKNPQAYQAWLRAVTTAEESYMQMLEFGATPEEARDVLPHSLATEIVITANMREWRHIFNLRTAADAHPKIRQLMKGILVDFVTNIPVLFDDIVVAE
ncbi:MAG: FAD-dependent thymidylate synthase [bacterium]|nr:FAD-dependent thymidylate synthase [bacterium]